MAARAEARYALTAEDRSRAAFASFNQRLGRTGEKTKRLGRETSSFFSMGRVGAALAGAAVIGGISRVSSMVNATFDTMDSINKLSERSGMSVDFLSRFAHVAEIGGSSLKDITGGMRRFGANIGEAARAGSGAAHEAFRQLGLDAKKLDKMHPDQAFLRVADALARVKTAARKSELAQDLFGRSGFNFLNALNLGSEGIKSGIELARSRGIGFSKADADKASLAVDARTRLEAQQKGFSQDASLFLAPFITGMTDRVAKDLSSFRTLGVESIKESVTAPNIAGRAAQTIGQSLLPFAPIEGMIHALKKALSDSNDETLNELREINANTAQASAAVAG